MNHRTLSAVQRVEAIRAFLMDADNIAAEEARHLLRMYDEALAVNVGREQTPTPAT